METRDVPQKLSVRWAVIIMISMGAAILTGTATALGVLNAVGGTAATVIGLASGVATFLGTMATTNQLLA